MILDLGLPDISGLEVLKVIAKDSSITMPHVVVYSARELLAEEYLQINEFTNSIVIKGSHSPQRLIDEVSLFLHSMNKSLPRGKVVKSIKNNVDSSFQGKRVLVVDDDVRNMFALSKSLRSRGFVVEMAKDGENAINAVNGDKQFDLVLMDVMMPGMDGLEATKIIRSNKRHKDLPIIAITAKAMRGDKEKCIAAGANEYLSKPVDMDKLYKVMKEWLQIEHIN